MHEELYLKSAAPLRILFLICGTLLLPFAFLNVSLVGTRIVFGFLFDLPVLIGAAGLSALFFLPFDRTPTLLLIPCASVLIAEFLRFGTVTIFERTIPFDRYMSSVMWMAAAFFITFFLYFVTAGKLRSKLPLILTSLFFAAAAILSAVLSVTSFALPPFGVLEEITEGTKIVSLSAACGFFIYNVCTLILAFSFCDDRVKEEKKRRKSEKA